MTTSPEAPVVVWFRRDLRLDDNTALASASAHGAPIVPLWVWDDRLLVASEQGSARQIFYLQSLASLASDLARLGLPLLVRRGAPERVVPAVAAELGARAVHWNEDYTPLARRRDRAVAAALASQGIGAHPHTDLLLHHPGLLVRDSGDPQTVYGAFRRAWEALPKPEPAGGSITLTPLASPPAGEPLPPVPAAGNLPEAGEEAARQLLQAFCSGGIDGYAEQRNLPAVEGVSRLSPHLRVGSISPRRVYQAATQTRERRPGAATGATAFQAELAWREFFYHVAFHVPRMLRASFQPAYEGIAWRGDREDFAAWCEGRTGYPFVDAAMRQLTSSGWMHNRARLAAGSFLCKDLLLSWQSGERFFMQHLADGDQIVNNGNWQWVAGTGCDAAPYFRVFNPTLQGRKFDPEGLYIRRFVPELRAVPTAFLHEPWRMSLAEQRAAGCLIGRHYPAPMVEHDAARQRALEAYASARQAVR